MSVVKNKNGRGILLAMVHSIQQNKQLLGDVDGLIGDGDHGMNMNKGFTLYEEQLGDQDTSLSDGLFDLGSVLLNKIGGSMGPIYGTIFRKLSSVIEDVEDITLETFSEMLRSAWMGFIRLLTAVPVTRLSSIRFILFGQYVREAANAQTDFSAALEEMKQVAEQGKQSTKDLTAKYGRAARLGERSRGVLDAGATSCCILLQAMADGMKSVLEN